MRASDSGIPARSPDPDRVPNPLHASVFACAGIPLGQFYNGRTGRGIAWAVGALALAILMRVYSLPAPAAFFFLCACTLDAYSTAKEIGRGEVPYSGPSRLFWAGIMIAISLALAAGLTAAFTLLRAAGS